MATKNDAKTNDNSYEAKSKGKNVDTTQVNNPTPNPQPLDQPEQQSDPNNPMDGNGHRDAAAGQGPYAGKSAVEIERMKVQNETGNDPGPNVTPRPESIQQAKQ